MKLSDYTLISPTAKKAVSLAQFNDDSLWREQGLQTRGMRNKQGDINQSSNYRDAIGTLYRCIDIRAATLASLPFTILKDNKVLMDSNNAWEIPDFEWIDDIQNLLALTEASLLLSSEAFWFKQYSLTGKLLGLQWLAAPYIDPIYDEMSGVVGFRRNFGMGDRVYTPEEVSYFYVQNPLSELIPDIPQAIASANSADVILNYEEFVSKFYERGAVKATILKVDRSTPPKERTRLKEFWQAFMSGKKNAYATEVVSGDVEAEVIGEGAGDSEKTEVLTSRRKDIATTMGVPFSLLFGDTSSSYTAGPTETKNFLNFTIIPRTKTIQAVLNKTIFKPQGLYLKFSVDNLPAFKDSGETSSKIFTTYTNALLPHSISAQLAGISLPEGVEYEDLDKFAAAERERQFKEKERIVTLNSKLTPDGAQGGSAAKPKGEDNNVKALDEKDEEIKKYRKWLRNRKDSDYEYSMFRSEVISDDEKLEIWKSFIEETGGQDSSNAPFSSIKALVTYGNRDGEEPEGLSDLEKATALGLSSAFAFQMSGVFADADKMTEQEFLAAFRKLWGEYATDLQNYILTMELDYAMFGVEEATRKVKVFAPWFQSEESSFEARQWATQRASDVFLMVQDSSLRRAEAIFKEYTFGASLGIGWIVAELRKFINAERAKVISENEGQIVIRHSAEIVYRNVGLVQYVRWATMRDERVCNICGPRHGMVYPLLSVPPIAHVGCRCQILPMADNRISMGRLFP